MARERICQYGNCQETKITITVNDTNGLERPAFCCREHTALYLLRSAWQYEGRRAPSYADALKQRLDENLQH